MATGDQKPDNLQTKNLQTGEKPVQRAKQNEADRLSKALRDNLYRRKAQARLRKLTDAAADMAEQKKKGGM